MDCWSDSLEESSKLLAELIVGKSIEFIHLDAEMLGKDRSDELQIVAWTIGSDFLERGGSMNFPAGKHIAQKRIGEPVADPKRAAMRVETFALRDGSADHPSGG